MIYRRFVTFYISALEILLLTYLLTEANQNAVSVKTLLLVKQLHRHCYTVMHSALIAIITNMQTNFANHN